MLFLSPVFLHTLSLSYLFFPHVVFVAFRDSLDDRSTGSQATSACLYTRMGRFRELRCAPQRRMCAAGNLSVLVVAGAESTLVHMRLPTVQR